MATARDVEVPLSAEEVRQILAICSPEATLVGGQALAFWADHLEAPRPAELEPTVTADADFIGDSTLAVKLGKRLGWKTWTPTLDDATPNTGKVTHRLRGGVKQVDFLSGVVGLTTKDVVRRAVEVHVRRIGTIRVMHPVDVLDSRIQNLHLLPGKRTPAGIAQARLALEVVRAFIRQVIETSDERAGLKLLERVAAIAADIASIRVFVLYGIDPLDAVPIDSFRTTPKLHKLRWPRIVAGVRAKREAARKLARPT